MVYLPLFFTANIPVIAPRKDIEALNELENLKLLNKDLFSAVEDKLTKHLWFLSAENVCLALFDSAVSSETKNKMRHKILYKTTQSPRSHMPELNNYNNLKLEHLCNTNSLNFFKILNINHVFLSFNASSWHENEYFLKARECVTNIFSTNDLAERGVKIADEYNKILTKSPKEFNRICINAYEQRKKYRI